MTGTPPWGRVPEKVRAVAVFRAAGRRSGQAGRLCYPAAAPPLLRVKSESAAGPAGQRVRAALPHPAPLPLGEGETPSAMGKGRRAGCHNARASRSPRPAGEGQGEGEQPRSLYFHPRPPRPRLSTPQGRAQRSPFAPRSAAFRPQKRPAIPAPQPFHKRSCPPRPSGLKAALPQPERRVPRVRPSVRPVGDDVRSRKPIAIAEWRMRNASQRLVTSSPTLVGTTGGRPRSSNQLHEAARSGGPTFRARGLKLRMRARAALDPQGQRYTGSCSVEPEARTLRSQAERYRAPAFALVRAPFPARVPP